MKLLDTTKGMQVKVMKTHFFDFWGQGLFRSTRDLAYEFVELALAKHTVTLALKLEGWKLSNDGLTHGAWGAISRTTHCGTR